MVTLESFARQSVFYDLSKGHWLALWGLSELAKHAYLLPRYYLRSDTKTPRFGWIEINQFEFVLILKIAIINLYNTNNIS